MKYLKFLVFFILPFFAFTSVHKYYLSVTEVEYVQEKKAVQIISKIFIDDFENLLRERYDKQILLADKNEQKTTDIYIKKYLTEKIKIKINDKDADFNFIGKQFDNDVITCYLEIEHVKSITSFEISNTVLFDMIDDQQNIIKTNINSQKKSYILISQKDTAVLKFN